MEDYHKPVLLGEVLVYLRLTNAHSKTKIKVIDATLGGGGYSIAFCKKGVSVLGIEYDPMMFKIAQTRLKQACPPNESFVGSFTLVKGNFSEIKNVALVHKFDKCDGVVFDLGVSTQQLTSPIRGFSFQNPNALLDMRMDHNAQSVKASDLLNALDKANLKKMFSTTCEYMETLGLVKKIQERRVVKPFTTVGDFLDVTKGIFKAKKGVNPVTKAFMALRMAVNSELENLDAALDSAPELLKSGGRLVVVSFHSGEDRIVKQKMLNFQKNDLGKVVTKRPVVSSDEEIEMNPRARSAKLRVFEKK